MSYIIAILVVSVFSVIYMIGYRLNSKVSVECDKKVCEGCINEGCVRRFEEEK